MKRMKSWFPCLVAACLFAMSAARAEEGLRPEVGKPLVAAQDLIKAGKYKEALSKIRDAEAVANRTPFESTTIDRMRGAAAAGAGDDVTAARSFEAVLAAGRLQGAERLQMMQAIASALYRAKDYAKCAEWAQRYLSEGGSNEQMRSLLVSAHYQMGDFAGVIRDTSRQVQASEQAVPQVDEQTLRLLAASQLKVGDTAGYESTLEKLLLHHPKKDYWADLLYRIQNRPGFSDRLQIDLLRLQFATGTLQNADQTMELAQLALQAGLPAEAKKVMDAAFASGQLGTGPEAERQRRLRDMANKQAAEDDKSLAQEAQSPNAEADLNVGQALVAAGQVDRGIHLMERGIAHGGLKRPDDALLHLGEAYLAAGKKAKSIDTFKLVRGGDGAADLARLWSLLARQG